MNPWYFLDSSAVIKRYVSETGSAWINALLQPAAGHQVTVAAVTGVEVIAAITRRERGGTLPAADAAQIRSQCRTDLASQYLVAQLTPSILARAMDLAELHGLRGYDALQLAAAVEVGLEAATVGLTVTLVSADAELNAAAAAEGLDVEDPNTQ